MTLVASNVKTTPIATNPIKKAASQKPWVSKYAQNPLGAHLKEHQNSKKSTPTRFRINKEAQGARKMQVVDNTPYFETANGKVKIRKGKDLR